MKVLIDTDGEFDDYMALMLVLKSSELNVKAITTLSGIRNLRESTDAVLNVVELLGMENVPVAEGVQASMSQDLTDTRERMLDIWKHGGRSSTKETRKPTLKPVREDGVSLMLRTVMEEPGEVTLITLGALTNVACALLREPRFADCVKDVYTMGGAVLCQGNTTPVSEFNIWGDPVAARIFFNSGMHITMVGLETYYQPMLSSAEWESVRRSSRAADYCFENFNPWFNYLLGLHPEWKGGLQIGDALTVGACINPTLMKTQRCFIDVETKGELTIGQTIAYGLSNRHQIKKKYNTDVCVDSDWRSFNKLFLERVTA